jgi:hypothetical protein
MWQGLYFTGVVGWFNVANYLASCGPMWQGLPHCATLLPLCCHIENINKVNVYRGLAILLPHCQIKKVFRGVYLFFCGVVLRLIKF